MSSRRSGCTFAAAVFALVACRHTPVPPISAGASDELVCAHIAALGCPSGSVPSCPVDLARLRSLDAPAVACVADAGSLDAATACGFECR